MVASDSHNLISLKYIMNPTNMKLSWVWNLISLSWVCYNYSSESVITLLSLLSLFWVSYHSSESVITFLSMLAHSLESVITYFGICNHKFDRQLNVTSVTSKLVQFMWYFNLESAKISQFFCLKNNVIILFVNQTSYHTNILKSLSFDLEVSNSVDWVKKWLEWVNILE